MWRSTLRVFELTGKTAARETAALTIEEPRDPSTRFVGAPQFGMCVRGDYAYFALTGTLATLDVRDPAHPRLVGRTEIAPAAVALYGAPQQVAIAGNRLYVQGLWPRRLLSFDLTDPARPTRAEEYDWRLRPGAVLGTPGGSLAVYLPRLNGALLFAPRPGLWPGRVRQLGGGPEGTPHPHRMTGVAFGDHVYALIDEERVAAFPAAGGV